MTTTEEPEKTAAANPAAVGRMPRFGAGASGLVSLLLVAGVLVVPVFGLLIAPLGLVPVLHYQADGSPRNPRVGLDRGAADGRGGERVRPLSPRPAGGLQPHRRDPLPCPLNSG